MIEIKITLQDDGQVLVTGPVQDAVLFNGLLELAKQVGVDARKQNIQKPRILVPQRKM